MTSLNSLRPSISELSSKQNEQKRNGMTELYGQAEIPSTCTCLYIISYKSLEQCFQLVRHTNRSFFEFPFIQILKQTSLYISMFLVSIKFRCICLS
jgi:hypothetical protein